MDTHDGMMLYPIWRDVNRKYNFINIFRNPIENVNGCYNVGQGFEKIIFNELIMFKKNKNKWN